MYCNIVSIFLSGRAVVSVGGIISQYYSLIQKMDVLMLTKIHFSGHCNIIVRSFDYL